jgi:hypothetical protein
MLIKKTPWLVLLLVVILTACQKATPVVSPTAVKTNADAVRTAAAQTADVRLNAIPSPTPNPPTPDSAALTQTAEVLALPTATATPDPSQPTAATVTPTLSGQTPSATPAPAGADKASFVKDITIPDNTVIAPGAKFTKTWQFLNAGTSNWSTAYELVWVSDTQLGSTTSIKLPSEVPAGQVVDISVELTAPTTDGTYKSYWRMRSPSGQYFGDAVYVQIKVGNTAATADPATQKVTNLAATVNNADVSTTCPYKVVISASFDVKEATTVSYQLEAGGFAFTLPAPRSEAFNAGSYTFTYELDIATSGNGWARLHVTSPVDKLSNEVTFKITCQ